MISAMYLKREKNYTFFQQKCGKRVLEMSPWCLNLISLRNIKLNAKKI